MTLTFLRVWQCQHYLVAYPTFHHVDSCERLQRAAAQTVGYEQCFKIDCRGSQHCELGRYGQLTPQTTGKKEAANRSICVYCGLHRLTENSSDIKENPPPHNFLLCMQDRKLCFKNKSSRPEHRRWRRGGRSSSGTSGAWPSQAFGLCGTLVVADTQSEAAGAQLFPDNSCSLARAIWNYGKYGFVAPSTDHYLHLGCLLVEYMEHWYEIGPCLNISLEIIAIISIHE